MDAGSVNPEVVLFAGPTFGPGEIGVHIIYVPDEVVLAELHGASVGAPPIAMATLKMVEKHVGRPAVTDIIVFAGQPWHYANGALRPHPQVHIDYPETVLRIRRQKQERAVWWSERPFEILKVRPEPPVRDDAALYPFTTAVRTSDEPGTDHQMIYVARSSVPVVGADFQEYKIEFRMEGRDIDPNMYCDGN